MQLKVELHNEDRHLGTEADLVLKTEKHAKAILRYLAPRQLSKTVGAKMAINRVLFF